MKRLGKFLSTLLVVSMVFAVFPTNVFATYNPIRRLGASTDETKLEQKYSWKAKNNEDVDIGFLLHQKATFKFKVDEAIFKRIAKDSAKIEIKILGSNLEDHTVALNGTFIGCLPFTDSGNEATPQYSASCLKAGPNSIVIETPHLDGCGVSILIVTVSFGLKPIHTVTFDKNYLDETIANPVPIKVTSGETIANSDLTMPVPERTDYDFVGWYTATGAKFDKSTVVDDNITVYAKWSAANKTYGVFHYYPKIAPNYHIGFLKNPFPYNVIEDEKIRNLANADYGICDGFELWGYKPNDTEQYKIATKRDTTTSDEVYDVSEYNYLAIHLIYKTLDKVAVTFDKNYADTTQPNPKTIELEKGKTLGESGKTLPTTTRANYDFVGWYTATGAKFDKSTVVDNNITVYAKWSVANKTYGVFHYDPKIYPNYHTDFSSNPFSGSVIREYDIKVLANPQYGVYEGFDLWGYKPNDSKQYLIATKRDTTTPDKVYDVSEYNYLAIHLIYKTLDKVAVTFDKNYADTTQPNPKTIELEKGKTLGESGKTLPTTTRANYDFVGWYTATGAKFDKSTVVDNNITVFAKWSVANKTYGVYHYSPRKEEYPNPHPQFETSQPFSGSVITKEKIEQFMDDTEYGDYEGYELWGCRPGEKDGTLIASGSSSDELKEPYDVSEYEYLVIYLCYKDLPTTDETIEVTHNYSLSGTLQNQLTTVNKVNVPLDNKSFNTSVWQKAKDGYQFTGISIKGKLKEIFAKPISEIQAQILNLKDKLNTLQNELALEKAKVIAEEAKAPAEEAKAPAEEAKAPAEEAKAPVEEAKAPAEEAKAPAEEAKAPAEEAKAPAEEAKAPAEEAKAPAEEAKAPAEEAKAPAEETKAPAEETKAPAEETKAPAKEINNVIAKIEKQIKEIELQISELQFLLDQNEITSTDVNFDYDARYKYTAIINYSKTLIPGDTGNTGNTSNTTTGETLYIPELEVALVKLPDDVVTIVDENVPLGKLPKSGGIQAANVGGSALLALMLSVILKLKKKED